MREVSYVVAVVTSLSSSWTVPVVVVVSTSVGSSGGWLWHPDVLRWV